MEFVLELGVCEEDLNGQKAVELTSLDIGVSLVPNTVPNTGQRTVHFSPRKQFPTKELVCLKNKPINKTVTYLLFDTPASQSRCLGYAAGQRVTLLILRKLVFKETQNSHTYLIIGSWALEII